MVHYVASLYLTLRYELTILVMQFPVPQNYLCLIVVILIRREYIEQEKHAQNWVYVLCQLFW